MYASAPLTDTSSLPAATAPPEPPNGLLITSTGDPTTRTPPASKGTAQRESSMVKSNCPAGANRGPSPLSMRVFRSPVDSDWDTIRLRSDVSID